jgi:hypothetical protein
MSPPLYENIPAVDNKGNAWLGATPVSGDQMNWTRRDEASGDEPLSTTEKILMCVVAY